jgi:hypothetical protein
VDNEELKRLRTLVCNFEKIHGILRETLKTRGFESVEAICDETVNML